MCPSLQPGAVGAGGCDEESTTTSKHPERQTQSSKKLKLIPLIFLIYFEVSGGSIRRGTSSRSSGATVSIGGLHIIPLHMEHTRSSNNSRASHNIPRKRRLRSMGLVCIWALVGISNGLVQMGKLGNQQRCLFGPLHGLSKDNLPSIHPCPNQNRGNPCLHTGINISQLQRPHNSRLDCYHPRNSLPYALLPHVFLLHSQAQALTVGSSSQGKNRLVDIL
ncbi:hypothetical protein SUGI_0009820 [Cryptomeria japonica]|nr:hypothetical protein SUGI_0009820 [Cryptomeria japonica]